MSDHCVSIPHVRVRKKSRPRCSCLFFILWIYLIVFVIGCVILLLAVLRIPKEGTYASDQKLPYVHFERLSHLEQRQFQVFGWPFKKVDLPFDCAWLSETNHLEFITAGWTKSVFKFQWRNESFALKTVNLNGEDIQRCVRKDSLRNCYEQASSKLLKEFILLRELQHPNIVKVLGWCVSEDNVAMSLELCSPLTTLSLMEMSFHQRLQVSIDLARLIYFLSTTSLGSVALNDFRHQQFVMCGDTIKLTDLDDVGIEEPKCRQQEDCTIGWCTRDICHGFNELLNVRQVFNHFYSRILAFETPPSVHFDLTNLLLGPKQWDSFYVLKLVERVSNKYCNNTTGCK